MKTIKPFQPRSGSFVVVRVTPKRSDECKHNHRTRELAQACADRGERHEAEAARLLRVSSTVSFRVEIRA
jgi:hypothetical protein